MVFSLCLLHSHSAAFFSEDERHRLENGLLGLILYKLFKPWGRETGERGGRKREGEIGQGRPTRLWSLIPPFLWESLIGLALAGCPHGCNQRCPGWWHTCRWYRLSEKRDLAEEDMIGGEHDWHLLGTKLPCKSANWDPGVAVHSALQTQWLGKPAPVSLPPVPSPVPEPPTSWPGFLVCCQPSSSF